MGKAKCEINKSQNTKNNTICHFGYFPSENKSLDIKNVVTGTIDKLKKINT